MGLGLGKLQIEILEIFEAKKVEGRLLKTGDVIDALGLERSKSVYPAISQSIKRLCDRGLVEVHQPCDYRRGTRVKYGLPRQDVLRS